MNIYKTGYLIVLLFVLSCYPGNAQMYPLKRENVSPEADMFIPLCLNDVKVHGEIGRRIDITLQNNIQRLDVDNDFILPFREKVSSSGFVGIGMFIDAVVKFAAYTRQDEIIAKKKYLVSKLTEARLEDGYMGMCLAQLEMYRLFPQNKLLKQSYKAIDFLTEGNGMVITGEAGQWEMWNNDQQEDDALGETSATAYLVSTYENLFRLMEAKYGDLMERTIYNALFAAQSPDGRRIRYYSPMKGPRKYFDKDTYCFPNNYRRIISEIPAMIYYWNNTNGICINLYSASYAVISLPNGTYVNMERETNYPRSGEVKIVISPSQPTYFPLQLRVLAWSDKTKMSVNGISMDMETDKSGFAIINRELSKNDALSLEIPMDWCFVKGRQRQAGRVAVMHGPVLFCLNHANNQGQGLEQMTDNEIGCIILDPSSPTNNRQATKWVEMQNRCMEKRLGNV